MATNSTSAISKIDDYPYDTTTTGVVTVNGAAVSGVINSMSDVDLFKVNLTAGNTYTFVLAHTADSLLDPYLELYSPNFELNPLAWNDEGAGSSNAKLFTNRPIAAPIIWSLFHF